MFITNTLKPHQTLLLTCSYQLLTLLKPFYLLTYKMPTTTKKCNLCHAGLRVSNEAQVVECPACGSINSYGYSRSNQNDKYNKSAPSKKNTGVMPNSQNYQQPPLSAAPTQGQAQLHVILLGGTKRPGSLHFVDTNSLFQQPPQASPEYSPPLAMTNGFLQPPPQVSPSSQVSIRMLKTNYTSFQQQSQNSLSLQSSLPPVKTKTTFQLPSQTPSPPIPERIINNFFQQPQQTSSPQGSPRPAYSNTSYEKALQASQPLIQEKVENFSQLAPQTSSPHGSPRLANSDTSYQPPLQSSQPPIQEKINSLSEPPHQTSSLKGSPNPSYSNTSNQQPIQSSPQESSHLPQTSSPQGSSPRPSRFGSFLKPRSAQTPPQASSPLAHSDDQKLSQPFSQTSTPPSREDNNGHNQFSTPPSSEANNGYSQKPLLGSPQMPASQVQPLLQAPRLSINSNGQNYQTSVPGTRPVSSSIASAPPLTGEQNIRYGTNQGTSGKFATANSQSADNQNSRNAEAFRGNMTGAPTNYINKPVADADDDPHYTKRRLKEFREKLQI